MGPEDAATRHHPREDNNTQTAHISNHDNGQPAHSTSTLHSRPFKPSSEEEDEAADENQQHTMQHQQQQQQPVAAELQLGDFVGEHGAYQMSLTLLLFFRYVLLGLMANSGPLMTPDVTFYCQLPEREILMIMPNISRMSERERDLELKEEFKQICQIDLHLYQNQSLVSWLLDSNSTAAWAVGRGGGGGGGGSSGPSGHSRQTFKTSPIATSGGRTSGSGHELPRNMNLTQEAVAEFFATRIRECTDFSYQLTRDQGRTMTSEFDLVCDRDWLRSLFQSMLSAAIVVAHVFWGTFSDKFGRFQAQRICLVVSFLAGLLSIFAWDFWSFTLTRALCSFGDLGLVVSMTTVLVELVGSKYRGCSVALVNFGYALGVSLLPYIVAHFEDFRLVIGFTLLCHMVSMPLVLATSESVRWLLTNRRFKEARRELRRIARWNRRLQSRAEATGAQDPSAGHSKPARISSREARRAFEAKFAEFVKQIESQNLYDPTTAAGAESGCHAPFVSACPTPRVPRPASALRRSPLPLPATEHRSDVSVPGRFRFPPPPTIVTTPPTEGELPEAGAPPPQPRVLAQLDLEQLELIREVESRASEHGSNRHSLLNETLIRSLEMRHEQRLLDAALLLKPPAALGGTTTTQEQSTTDGPASMSRASSVSCNLTLAAAAAAEPTAQQVASIREWHLAHRGHPPPPDCINLVAHQLSFVGRVSRLFKDKQLMIAVFTIVWTTFNSELLYTSFIIINLEVGEDLYLNYILGGCMEALAAVVASLLLSYSPRRISLIAFWLLISLACFGLSLAHIDSTWAVWMLALAKFSQSCLSSIATVAAYESFPTFLRQSGSGLVFTLGMLGSVFAPLIFAEFDDHAGMDRVLMTFSVSSLTAATLIYLFLNETRDCELM